MQALDGGERDAAGVERADVLVILAEVERGMEILRHGAMWRISAGP